MSKPAQSIQKVLGVVCHCPLDRIGIPLPPGIFIRCAPYPIGCSSGIVLTGLQGRQRWWDLGWGGH